MSPVNPVPNHESHHPENPSPDKTGRTFRDLYCAQFRCPPEQFVNRIFRRCLFLHAKPAAWVIVFINKWYFNTDFYFIKNVGNLTNPRDFGGEESQYLRSVHYEGGLRHFLRLRISNRRLHRLVIETWRTSED